MAEDRVDRLERLTNLVTFLLETERGVTYAEIIDAIPGYPAGAEARRRAFERDKKLLRDEDIPVVLDEESGRYRIPPEEYYLPDLGLTEEEQVALQLAVAAVPVSAADADAALQKLTLGRSGTAPAGITATLAQLDEHPLLPTIHGAIRRRSSVTFSYSGSVRTVEPGLLFFRDGYWYLHGYDRLRGGSRNFRIDRISGDVEAGLPGELPATSAEADPATAMPRQPWLLGDPDAGADSAVIHVDPVLASKAAADAGPSAAVDAHPDGSVTITMPVIRRDLFRDWVLGMLEHAEVVAPSELRASVVEWLSDVAGGESS